MDHRTQRALGSRAAAALAMAVLVASASGACRDSTTTGPAPPASSTGASPDSNAGARPARSVRAAAVAHGGVGSPVDRSDGCRKAVDAALSVLEAGADPIDAAVAGVTILEDDPRFNAGTGAIVRLDGTIQMDASVMDSTGRFGAVAGIENVKNPVKIARAVLDTPHLMLIGDGATRFARVLGMPHYDPSTPERRASTERIKERLRRSDPTLPQAWTRFDWRSRWNYAKTIKEAGLDPADAGTDTVGVAVRTADGRFAAALSTGGTAITLRGRVGDVPIYGAGLYAGPHGASAATGSGERIIEASLGRTIDGWLSAGAAPADAATRAVDLVKGKGDIGVIVIGAEGLAAAADRPMAWAGRVSGEAAWSGPGR